MVTEKTNVINVGVGAAGGILAAELGRARVHNALALVESSPL